MKEIKETDVSSQQILNVTPQQLKNKVREMRQVMSDLTNLHENRYMEFTDTVQGMWTGIAAKEYKQRYEKVYENTKQILQEIAEYTDKLDAMAMNYEQAENKASEDIKANMLPTIF